MRYGSSRTTRRHSSDICGLASKSNSRSMPIRAPSKSYSLNAVEYTRVGSAIMPAETLSRVLAEQLHPAAQVNPGIGEFEYAPNRPQTQSGSMSQMGQTRTSASLNGMSVLPSTADVVGPPQHVRFVPQTGIARLTQSPRQHATASKSAQQDRAPWPSWCLQPSRISPALERAGQPASRRVVPDRHRQHRDELCL